MAIGCTIEELDERIGEEELAFWRAKFSVELPPSKADWARYANSQALFANCNRNTKKKKTPFEFSDFLPEDI